MTLEQLINLKYAFDNICSDNCALLIWSTGPKLSETITLIKVSEYATNNKI